MSNKQVEIDCAVVRSTAAAVCIDVGGKDNIWVPKSIISDYTGESVDTADSIFIPEWIAIEKGLV